MSYIRTKDGIIIDLKSKEVSSWEYIDNDTAINEYGVEGAFYAIYYFDENKGNYSDYDGKGGHSMDSIGESEILNQSENLEELCDEFVYYNPKTQIEKYRYEYYHNLSEKEYDMLFLKKGGTIYGAVWCEFGLKYVAKLNSKGELELL